MVGLHQCLADIVQQTSEHNVIRKAGFQCFVGALQDVSRRRESKPEEIEQSRFRRHRRQPRHVGGLARQSIAERIRAPGGKQGTDTATQRVSIPAGKTSATLAFYLHIDTQEVGSIAYDTLRVQVLNTSGTVLATLATYSNVNAASGYSQKSLNMNAYIGQTVQIRFYGHEDSSLATSFVIDDVTLTVQ